MRAVSLRVIRQLRVMACRVMACNGVSCLKMDIECTGKEGPPAGGRGEAGGLPAGGRLAGWLTGYQ